MLAKNIRKELSDYLKKHDAPWLTSSQEDREVPTLGGYPASKSEDHDKIALDAFLKNKKIFSGILMDAVNAFDQKKGEQHKFSEIYKKAFISKQVFSNVFNGGLPSKDTVFMFAFALEISAEEAEKLLKYAGYSFGDCVKRDLILKFCFEKKMTDILDINELLTNENERPLLKDRRKPQTQSGKKLVVLQ
jgi:hypothetical protein